MESASTKQLNSKSVKRPASRGSFVKSPILSARSSKKSFNAHQKEEAMHEYNTQGAAALLPKTKSKRTLNS